jgi:hypothetical protein
MSDMAEHPIWKEFGRVVDLTDNPVVMERIRSYVFSHLLLADDIDAIERYANEPGGES